MDRGLTFYLQHGHGTAGPFRTESAMAVEDWKPQKRRGSVIACRFVVFYEGKWRRLYSDSSATGGLSHFIKSRGERIAVSGVCP